MKDPGIFGKPLGSQHGQQAGLNGETSLTGQVSQESGHTEEFRLCQVNEEEAIHAASLNISQDW